MEELISCPSCGGEVSPRAVRCKHCGVRLRERDDDTLARVSVPPRPATGDLSSLVPESPAHQVASTPPAAVVSSDPEPVATPAPAAPLESAPAPAVEAMPEPLPSLDEAVGAPEEIAAVSSVVAADPMAEPAGAPAVDKQHAGDPTMALVMDDVDELMGSEPQDTTDVSTRSQRRGSRQSGVASSEPSDSVFGRIKTFFSGLFRSK